LYHSEKSSARVVSFMSGILLFVLVRAGARASCS
jgi:hypothetical protein